MCNKKTKNKLLKFFENFCCKVENKKKETLEEKDKYFKNLKLKDMVEHYNYINEHYTKQHKKWTGDIIGNIIIIAEASALIITIIFKTINLPKEVCSIMNLSQISFTKESRKAPHFSHGDIRRFFCCYYF